MKPYITGAIKFLNDNYDTNNKIVIDILNSYIHSSHCHSKRNWDGTTSSWQPSWPEETVIGYKIYYDPIMKGNHKEGRIMLYLNSKCETEIGLFKFKRYFRKVFKYHNI